MNQLKRLTKNRKRVSQRRLGRLSKINISCFKCEKKMADKAKNLCKKLVNLLYRSSCCLVLDDEKYFTYDGSIMQGNDNYYTNDKSKCPDSVHLAGKEKYPDKIRVWVAISNSGLSKPLFPPSKSKAVNSDIF